MSGGAPKTCGSVSGGLLAIAALLVTAVPTRAQDIETIARLRGLELPAAYYARVQEDPSAYTLPNGLFRTTAAGRSKTYTRTMTPVAL